MLITFLYHIITHGAYVDCRSAHIHMYARVLTKPDESMNPYESAMNPIQKTDESMNPLEFDKRREGVLFLIRYGGFMDSSVF